MISHERVQEMETSTVISTDYSIENETSCHSVSVLPIWPYPAAALAIPVVSPGLFAWLRLVAVMVFGVYWSRVLGRGRWKLPRRVVVAVVVGCRRQKSRKTPVGRIQKFARPENFESSLKGYFEDRTVCWKSRWVSRQRPLRFPRNQQTW